MKAPGRTALAASLLMGLATVVAAVEPAAPATQSTFATPEEAVMALRPALEVHDKAALHRIFGAGLDDLLTGDAVQDKANSRRFAEAVREAAVPVAEGDGRFVIEVGAKRWPFPIPLVKESAGWRFDTAAGKEEIINRHIGKDELHAIGFCRAFAAAHKKGGGRLPTKPYHGYLLRLLPSNPAGGLTFAAYPERWGRSGIMTFVVDADGKIFQRNNGVNSTALGDAMNAYVPGGDWTPVTDPGVDEAP